MRCRAFLVGVLLIVSAGAIAQSRPASSEPLPDDLTRLINYVPDDSHLVLVIPSLVRLIEGVSRFGQAAGIDPLAELTAERILRKPLGNHNGAVDINGPFALAISAQHPELLLIGLVTSIDAWQGAAKPAHLPNDALLFELGNRGYLATSADGVALIARERSTLERALRSSGTFRTQFAQHAAARLTGRQALLWADVAAWRTAIKRQLQVIAQSAQLGLAAAGPDAEASQRIWTWLFAQLDRLADEAESYSVAAQIGADGVLLQDCTTFRAGSRIRDYLAALRTPPRDLLRGLPADPAALVFAAEWEVPAELETIDEKLVRVMLGPEKQRETAAGARCETALRESVAAHRTMTGYNGLIAWSEAEREFLYGGVYFSQSGDTLRKHVRGIYEACPELMSSWGVLSASGPVYTTENIAGAEADVYRFTVAGTDGRADPLMQALYGEQSVLCMAAHPDGVAYALSSQTGAHTALTRLLAQDGPRLSTDARVGPLFKVLSPHPQGCVVIDVPRTLNLFGSMLRSVGLSCPSLSVEHFGNMPLAGATFYLEPQRIRSELYVPSAPVRALIETFGYKRSDSKSGQ